MANAAFYEEEVEIFILLGNISYFKNKKKGGEGEKMKEQKCGAISKFAW